MDLPIVVSVQAAPRDRTSWLSLARAIDRDDADFATLYVADHPGSTASPFVALAAAAAVTERIRLGTCVINAGLWEPFALASAVATLDVLSSGRSVLGIGAGHTPAEWSRVGATLPAPGERVGRMEVMIDVVTRLLAGVEVTRSAFGVELVQARLGEQRVQDRVPIMVGGAGARVLRIAARTADIVGVTGLGVTQADGHTHSVDWSAAAVGASLDRLRTDIDLGGRDPVPAIEALVQHVEITDDAEAAAARLAADVEGAEVEDVLDVPYMWIGTAAEIAARLHRHRQRWDISRYVVRAPAIDAATQVMAQLG